MKNVSMEIFKTTAGKNKILNKSLMITFYYSNKKILFYTIFKLQQILNKHCPRRKILLIKIRHTLVSFVRFKRTNQPIGSVEQIDWI